MPNESLESRAIRFRLDQLKRRAAEYHYHQNNDNEISGRIENNWTTSIIRNYVDLGMSLSDLESFIDETKDALIFIGMYANILLFEEDQRENVFNEQIKQLTDRIIDASGEDTDHLKQELSINNIEPLCYRIFSLIQKRISDHLYRENLPQANRWIDLLFEFSNILDQDSNPNDLAELSRKIFNFTTSFMMGYTLANLEKTNISQE